MANYTDVDDSSSAFQVKTYSGSNSSNAVTFDGNSNLQPDWLWMKKTNGSANHFAYDVIRGANRSLVPNDTDAQDTSGESTSYLTSFNSNGFTLAGNYDNTNKSGNSYVAWGWKAGGSPSNNTTGDITASQSANATAGFSVSTFNTNGQSGTMTCGHGLSSAPKMIIVKPYTTSDDWYIYHHSLGNAKYIRLNQTASSTSNSNTWASTSPTSSVFSMSTNFWGANTNGLIAYCFAEKRGFSSFGSYFGTGATDGTFVFCGFKPAWVLCKLTSGSGYGWTLFDNKRAGYNQDNYTLQPDGAAGQNTSGGNGRIDILSNGFKLRTTDAGINGSGSEYLYMAFAENPFVTSTGVPALAR